jgi:hypothetical protein
MKDIDASDMKRWAVEIVDEVSPEDSFVVEQGFDAIATNWYRADTHDEGRFIGAAELGTFAALVVPFLIGFIGDVVKDVIKDAAKKALGAELDKLLKRKTSPEESQRLKAEVLAAIDKSRFTTGDKATLRTGFDVLFARVGATK